MPAPTATETATPVASNQTRVTVNVQADVAVNSEFIVTVEIAGVSNLNAVSYTVLFAPQILELLTVESGAVGGSAIPVDFFNENPAGVVTVLQSLPGLGSASGDGPLARLRFRFIGEEGATSDIGFDAPNSILSSTKAEEIETSWTDGTVRGVSQN